METRIHNDKVLKEYIEATKKSQLEGPSVIEDEMELTPEEAYQARLKRSKMNSDQPFVESSYSVAPDDASKGENKIKKMMEAMGWKGKGLGKQEQGIINPLVAKKTDATSGFIEESQITNISVI